MQATTPNQVPGTPARSCGHEFTWTDQHPRIQDIRRLLYTYDTLGSEAMAKIDAISPLPSHSGPPDPSSAHNSSSSSSKCPFSTRDPYAILEKGAHSDPVLHRLWNEVNTPPDWVDWDQISRGQRVVYRYHGQMMLGLLFNSLLGGMGGWRVCETLDKTGGFGPQVTRRRLLETAQHFLEVVRDVDSVKPGGAGFVSSVRVRLLHATVRRRILQLQGESSESSGSSSSRDGKGLYYDVEACGVPINHLHQMATIDAYSTSLVFLSLPRQGVRLSPREAADFLALWRWVGYVMGTPVDCMATTLGAKMSFESILVSEVRPSDKSRVLANNILTSQANAPPLFASRGFLAAVTYRLIGEDMAVDLAIDAPSAAERVLAWAQSRLSWIDSAVYPWLPDVLRERRDRRFIQNSYHFIMDKASGGMGRPTKFPFKYRPAHGKSTGMASYTVPGSVILRSMDPARFVLGVSICLVVLVGLLGWSVQAVLPWEEVVVHHRVPRFAVPSEQVFY
ncbi:hypothetical protein GMORB2_6395 [Geosmithia morbida]|uniref:ER-bound oxygenase mpaB/mpaB'/Rubber oxygenase catalytic domain-containing protein n=1 Tax=Geosmithia morbida TaxID=1094350 RepID=A0A9P5D6N5_9HYPO|nr:uncharacterized protein GMORB2_6395 [Geosmithia morbida]KAF4123694.1 hypothetical protein GMORB2_6395 [Geosmithia morbida]